MADQINFNLNGVGDVLQRLRQLSPKLQKKGLRTAARKAMMIVRDAARESAKEFDDPETGNRIDKLIVIQESAKRSKRVGGVFMRVGVRGGALSAKNRLTPWYWRLKEFGSEHQRAEPFMRPALANNIERVTNEFTDQINKEIDKLSGVNPQ
jgi:HK97 gp10 family phage protein